MRGTYLNTFRIFIYFSQQIYEVCTIVISCSVESTPRIRDGGGGAGYADGGAQAWAPGPSRKWLEFTVLATDP